MGSVVSKLHEEQVLKRWEERKKWAENMGEKLTNLDPRSPEFIEFEYVLKNLKKIIKYAQFLEHLPD